MKMLLLADVVDLGKKGKLVTVKDGYARNFLIPQKLARVASLETEKQILQESEKNESEKQKETEKLQKLAQKINKLTINFKEKSGTKNKIFGSINENKIAQTLSKKLDFTISPKQIILEKHLKEIGKYLVDINLSNNIVAKLKVEVLAK